MGKWNHIADFFNGDMFASENDIIEEEAIKEKHNSIEGIIFNFLLQWMNDTKWMNMRLRTFRDFFNLLKRYSKVPLQHK